MQGSESKLEKNVISFCRPLFILQHDTQELVTLLNFWLRFDGEIGQSLWKYRIGDAYAQIQIVTFNIP